jgi:ABC-2 type transport system permease protein
MLRFYFEVARTAYRSQLIYRWANLAGLCANVFFGIVLCSIMIALYHTRPVTAGYTLRDTISYIWAAQALIMVTLPFGWQDLMLTIRTGEVISDLSKPCDFFLYWCSREIGRAVYYFLFRALPVYLIGTLLFGLEYSTNPLSWLLFFASLALGALSGTIYRVLLNLCAFWILEARAMITFGVTVAQFFAGNYLPIMFFPAWLYTLAIWLPFNGMINTPTQAFLGKLGGPALFSQLAIQLGWLLALAAFVRLITAIATRRVVVQGG